MEKNQNQNYKLNQPIKLKIAKYFIIILIFIDTYKAFNLD